MEHHWLALAVGNSRLHWGWFTNQDLVQTWDTKHLKSPVSEKHLPKDYLCSSLIEQNLEHLPVYGVSVVDSQTLLWQEYLDITWLELKDLPLTNLYPTLGIDRATAAWGAIALYNRSCLVIDGGTALTLTGVSQERKFIGGAIAPGLRTQLLSLNQKTAALPKVQLISDLPSRWAKNTEQAIIGGIIHMAISGIHDYVQAWQKRFPQSYIVFTGGDGRLLAKYFKQKFPESTINLKVEPNLIFQGIEQTLDEL